MNDKLILEIPVANESTLGAWKYMMTNTTIGSPYKEGVLFVTKKNDMYDVAVKFSNGILSGKDVIIKNEQIKFNLNIAGLERVSFVLFVEENRILGESYSVKGSSQITGMRQLPVR